MVQLALLYSLVLFLKKQKSYSKKGIAYLITP